MKGELNLPAAERDSVFSRSVSFYSWHFPCSATHSAMFSFYIRRQWICKYHNLLSNRELSANECQWVKAGFSPWEQSVKATWFLMPWIISDAVTHFSRFFCSLVLPFTLVSTESVSGRRLAEWYIVYHSGQHWNVCETLTSSANRLGIHVLLGSSTLLGLPSINCDSSTCVNNKSFLFPSIDYLDVTRSLYKLPLPWKLP